MQANEYDVCIVRIQCN